MIRKCLISVLSCISVASFVLCFVDFESPTISLPHYKYPEFSVSVEVDGARLLIIDSCMHPTDMPPYPRLLSLYPLLTRCGGRYWASKEERGASPGMWAMATYTRIGLWPIFAGSLIYPAIAFVKGPVRRRLRRRRGLCVICGYDLTGNVSGVCSECGQKLP